MIKRLTEYEKTLHDSVSKTVNHMNKGDALSHLSASQAVSFEYDKIHSIDDISYSGLSCRIFENGKVGNSYTNNPLSFQEMIGNAKESAIFGQEALFTLPKKNSYPSLPWLYQKKNLTYHKEDLKDMASHLLSEIKKFAPNAKVSTGAQNSYTQTFLQNTEGFQGFSEESALYLQGGLFELAPDGSFLEMYEGISFYDQDVDFNEITQPLEEQLVRSRNISKLHKTGKMPVIFAPSCVDMLLDPIEISANGKMLLKGLSLFENHLQEQMFSSKLNFIDDPHYLYGSSSTPFDDEGTVGKAIHIIREGVFENFIYDCMIASKLNTKTTGHASRSMQSLPVPSFTNRIILPGNKTLKEMISSVDYGIFLVASLGEGQSNIVAGDFSVLGETVYLIENGELKGKVKDIMISGNVFDLLKNIIMLENKIHKESSLFSPHILIDEVQISYK